MVVSCCFSVRYGRLWQEDSGRFIQPDAMESLLYDYHLASTMSSSVSYTENYKKDAYFKYVFQKHHVTEEEFDSSMVWYTRNSDQLATIYQNLQKRFENEEKHMKVQVAKRETRLMFLCREIQ